MDTYHRPVLVKEVLEFLDPAPDKKYIDATLGGGGHAEELLKRGAKVLALDRDDDAIEYVKKNYESRIKNKELIVVKANFNQIGEIANKYGFNQLDGILLDLGLSSHQLQIPARGFSFQNDGPLDMRMDRRLPIKAADIVNNFDERRLSEIFSTFGEENLSRPIARAISFARRLAPINSTKQLAQIISEVYEKKHKKSAINPATRTFQALRIVVNSELLNLEETMPQTVKILKTGKGRLVVISYQSLEDGIVKRFFKSRRDLKILTEKPLAPSSFEVQENPRARSAKLRAAQLIN